MANSDSPVAVCNILLVDDHYPNLLALSCILRRPDFRIYEASSGLEGLLLLESVRFSVILLDVKMPEMDGFEFAKRARVAGKNATTPLIFVTASAFDSGLIAKGYEHGAADYLTKPLNAEEVLAKVATFVELDRKNQRLEEVEQHLLQINMELEQRVESRAKDLAISNERFRIFVDGVKDYGFIQMDGDGRFITWNAGAEKILGYSEQEIIGLPFAKIFVPEDVAAGVPEKELQIALKLGRADDTRWHLKRDGQRFWAQGVTTVLTSSGGEIIGFAKVLRDCTIAKRVEEELKRSKSEAQAARQAAEEANRAKSMFLAGMSHEIRSPLSAIIGYSELLPQPDLTENERREFIHTIIRNSKALSTLIDDLLDLSKIEAGEITIERLPILVENLVSDVVSSLEGKARGKGLKLIVEGERALAVTIESDPTRLRQILINILGNAIKFTESGTVTLAMQLNPSAQDPTRTVFSFIVTDTGRGISQAAQNQIFKPYGQGDIATTRHYGGTGLGLDLSRKLARALGGDIVLTESIPEMGSTFTITIDPGTIHREGATFKRLAPLKEGSLPDAAVAKVLAGARVLIAEDTVDNQILLKRILNKWGMDVEVVENGFDAIHMVESKGFDIILMDIQMPVLDGNNAIIAIRNRGFSGPIIALTAHAMADERDKSFRAGANAHIPKPINPKRLISAMTQLIGEQG